MGHIFPHSRREQARQQERTGHLDELRSEQQLLPLGAVGETRRPPVKIERLECCPGTNLNRA